MKIGIISDTHGFLDPRVEKIFDGVEHILHAGDIGDAVIELELKFIAPVTVVQGNVDIGLPFNLTEIVTLASKKFLVHHIVNPWALSETVEPQIKKQKPDAVIFGHIPVTRASPSSARNAAWRFSLWSAKKSGTSLFRSD